MDEFDRTPSGSIDVSSLINGQLGSIHDQLAAVAKLSATTDKRVAMLATSMRGYKDAVDQANATIARHDSQIRTLQLSGAEVQGRAKSSHVMIGFSIAALAMLGTWVAILVKITGG